ncbi:hypothetical protein B4168_1140 [Anoxybacillus flavithermus]|nr:hypothetical protein B4168_1140 [Anoxybacillus flavithermus]OAO88217.1 hypothetical protein GT23_0493 [Parageobacillus thermoglucosidasius]
MEFVSSFLGYARKAEMYGRKPKCVKTKKAACRSLSSEMRQ